MGLIRKKNDNKNAKQESKKPMSKGKKRLIGVALMMCLLFVMVSLNYLVARAEYTTNENHNIKVILSSTAEYTKKINKENVKQKDVPLDSNKSIASWYWVNDDAYKDRQGDPSCLVPGTNASLRWTQEDVKFDSAFLFSGDVSYNTPFVFYSITAPTGYKYVGMKAIENYGKGGSIITDLTFFPMVVNGRKGYVVDVGCYWGNWVSYDTAYRMNHLFRLANSTVKIIPQVEPIKYKIKYWANGAGTKGSTPMSTHLYEIDSPLSKSGFDRPGYNFLGWNTKKDGTGSLYGNGATLFEDLSETDGDVKNLYAQWTPKVSTVTLDGNGATSTDHTKSFYVKYKTGFYQNYDGENCSSSITKVKAPTRTGYNFKGYYENLSDEDTKSIYKNGKIYPSMINTKDDKTLTAKWTKNKSTLVVDPNQGEWTYAGTTYTKSKSFDDKPYGQTMTIPKPKRTGYEFKGWKITGDKTSGKLTGNTSPWSSTKFEFGFEDDGEFVITAKWQKEAANVITITLDNQGATKNRSVKELYIYNGSLSKDKDKLTPLSKNSEGKYIIDAIPEKNVLPDNVKPKATFNGYIDEDSGTKYIYSSGTVNVSGIKNDIKSDITLYADWEPVESVITLDNTLDGVKADLSEGTKKIYVKYQKGVYKSDYTTAIDEITIPKRTGFNFTGYYKNPKTTPDDTGLQYVYSGGSINISGAKTFYEDRTLYSRWQRNKSTLTVDANGGTRSGVEGAVTKRHSYEYEWKLEDPIWDNYIFTGWEPDDGFNAGKFLADGQTFQYGPEENGEGTLTAQWDPVVYTINLNAGSDVISAGTSKFYEWYGEGNYSDKAHNYQIETITIPTRTGYTFDGYYDSNGDCWVLSDGTIVVEGTPDTYKTFNSTNTVNGQINLSARWNKNKSTLILDPNGGRWSDNSIEIKLLTGEYGTTQSVPVPTKSGDNFIGWEEVGSGNAGKSSEDGKTFTFGSNKNGESKWKAKWSTPVYTITLNNQGATTAGTSVYYEKYGYGNYTTSSCTTTITKITIPTKTNNTFKGYWTTPNGNNNGTPYVDVDGNIRSSATTFTSDIILYAHWEEVVPDEPEQETTKPPATINSSTLTIDPNGGKWTHSGTEYFTPQSFTQNYNTTMTVENPTWDGRTFTGWVKSSTFTAGSLSGTTFTFGNTKNGVGTLTASWRLHKSTITINPNGGRWEGSQNSTSITKNYGESRAISIPIREGYLFNGWTVSGTAGTLYSNEAPWDSMSFSFGAVDGGSGTITANWVPITFKVAYDGNGATGGSTPTSTHTYNDTSDTFRKNGYERKFTITFDANGGTVSPTSGVASAPFNGWATSSTGAKEYDDQASVPNLTTINGQTVTLYAKWRDATLSSLPTPTRTGYTFDYWYIQETNGTKTPVTTSTNFTSNTTIYAHWTPNKYNIHFDENGATDNFVIPNPKEVTFGKEFPSVTPPKREYTVTYNANGGSVSPGNVVVKYTFKGFYDSEFSEQYYDESGNPKFNNYKVAGDSTYYAKWESKSTTLPTPMRTGYTFQGWYVKNTNTNVGMDGESYTPTSDVELVASWRANKYTIHYYNGDAEIGTSRHTYNDAPNAPKEYLTTWSTLGGVVKNSSYGWEFAGWATSSNSYTVTYTDGQGVLNLTAVDEGNIYLYAVYKRTITFKHGDGGSKTNTETQQWNPSGNTNGTHVGPVSSPELEDVTNWTDGGFRNDESATSAGFGENTTIYPPVDQSPTFYGSYYRDVTFKSGVNATVTDKIERQYLTSNGNKVSAITSGNPSAVIGWTPLGYRDDTTASTSEYASNSTIAPAYTTPNTFYATYSRTLTVGYSANNVPPLVASGSVADTTKTVYMNSASTSTSDQSITLRKNGFTYIGYKFVKWDVGYPDSTYNPGLPYNHGTFKVVAYAVWEHDGSGVGTLFTPILKVSNPSDSGIYYNDGVYFVKGDGNTAIELYGEAKLDPALITRVDKLSLNDGENVLTSNPKYTETYNVEVPKYDVLEAIYKKENVTNYNTHTGLFKKLGEPSIVDITQSKFSFKQKFTITGRVLKEQYIGARASCMDRNCTDASHTLVAYGNSVRFHGDPYKPYAYIVDESGKQVSTNEYDTKWTNQEKVTVVFKDDDSGIKEYKFTEDGVVLKEKENTEYVTNESIVLDLKEGVKEYVLKVEDNVGNLIVITFTPHVDRTAPSLTDLIDYKVMASGNVSQGRSDVYTGNGNTDAWPTTSKDATWEYDWQKLKELSYKATDDRAGLRNVKITHYKQDSSYTTAWKGETLVNVVGDVLNASKEQLITSFNGDTYYEEGKSYLLIEMEDLPGNRTVVKLVVRRDKNGVKISNSKVTPTKLENFKSSELESLFASGDMSKFKTNVRFSIDDKVVTGDTGGIKKLEVIVLDPSTNAELKRYDVTSNLAVSSYTDETNKGDARFAPLVRALTGSINVNIDTMGEFPGYTHLKFAYEVEDHVGNKTLVEDRSVVEGGEGPGVVPNFSMKTTVYATKDNAYNIATSDGLSSMAYFKTGEVGYVEVWSVGYVERIELDFSEGGVGQKMNEAIGLGLMEPKYILGVHNGLPNQVRFVDLKGFKLETPYGDHNGVPYASHIGYEFSEVNNSTGAYGVDGWKTKGSMVRIPTTYELVKRNELDKYGNELYEWEVHEARVYPTKLGKVLHPSASHYTIWDEAGDDLHFRVTHQTFGY